MAQEIEIVPCEKAIYNLGDYVKRIQKPEADDCIEWREGTVAETEKPILVKLEKIDTKIPRLNSEYRHLKLLSDTAIVPKLLHFGPHLDSYALVTKKLGKTIEEIFVKEPEKMDIRFVTNLAVQCIELLQALHNRGFVHRLISPECFQFGRPNTKGENKLYITELGLAKMYLEKPNEHMRFYQHHHLMGIPRYMSINAHQKKEQSRRDDMESLGYVLIYLLRGSLPWQGLKGETVEQVWQAIADKKCETSLESLCERLPNAYLVYLSMVRKLDYVQRPDYDHLKGLFQHLDISS